MKQSGVEEKAFYGQKSRRMSLYTRISGMVLSWWHYVSDGVWSDMRRTFFVNAVKTINLSVRSFLNSELQIRAAALTYQTILAIVPALALLFAIGRGFGFQNIIQSQLLGSFPAQQEALSKSFEFVDSYLAQSSEGIFLGIGLLFLLWTVVSLISSVEDSFNAIWGISGRTLWRKLTDYTAIVLILPILIICSSGIRVFLSSALQALLPSGFVSPMIKLLLDFTSLVLVWLFFTGSYMLVPNTKVKFGNAFLAGVIAGSGYCILQWLFLSGQLYVTRYNAVYGSFAFLPLLLLWLQLVWTITLAGGVLCFSSQNIFEFSFNSEISRISNNYKWRITLAVMTVAVQRFDNGFKPMTPHEIAVNYDLPISLVNESVGKLIGCGLLMRVVTGSHDDEPGIAPAVNTGCISLGMVLETLGASGSANFIPTFNRRFGKLSDAVMKLRADAVEAGRNVLLSSLTIEDIASGSALLQNSDSKK